MRAKVDLRKGSLQSKEHSTKLSGLCCYFYVRPALSLLELLVVISILAGLVGLLLPAVQSVRQSSQKLTCQNKLAQLGKALAHYESERGIFPTGIATGRSKDVPETYRWSWLVELLPYIDQTSLYQQAMDDWRNTPPRDIDPKDIVQPYPSHLARFQRVALFLCPSNSQPKIDSNGRAPTDYLGVSGHSVFDSDGIIFRDSLVRFADISDGSSNTLLIVERPFDGSKDNFYGYWYGGSINYVNGGYSFTGMYEYPWPNSMHPAPTGRQPYRKWESEWAQLPLGPWSYHSGGSNMAFADGSVRFIRYSAGHILPALATRAGGETFELP